MLTCCWKPTRRITFVQRMMYASVQASGGLIRVNIEKLVLPFVRNAQRRYQEALEILKCNTTSNDKKKKINKHSYATLT